MIPEWEVFWDCTIPHRDENVRKQREFFLIFPNFLLEPVCHVAWGVLCRLTLQGMVAFWDCVRKRPVGHSQLHTMYAFISLVSSKRLQFGSEKCGPQHVNYHGAPTFFLAVCYFLWSCISARNIASYQPSDNCRPSAPS